MYKGWVLVSLRVLLPLMHTWVTTATIAWCLPSAGATVLATTLPEGLSILSVESLGTHSLLWLLFLGSLLQQTALSWVWLILFLVSCRWKRSWLGRWKTWVWLVVSFYQQRNLDKTAQILFPHLFILIYVMRDRNRCPAQREVSCVNCCQEEMIPFKDERKIPWEWWPKTARCSACVSVPDASYAILPLASCPRPRMEILILHENISFDIKVYFLHPFLLYKKAFCEPLKILLALDPVPPGPNT